MGFLDGLLNAFLKATDPRPRYTEARCLLYKNSVGGCDKCYGVCPKGAVRPEGWRVELDEVLCTGCGLCTGVCPGIALEYPLGAIQEALIRGKGKLRCSKAEGKGEEVLCLGRLTPGLLAEAGSRFGKVVLARGDCEACRIGGPEVPERLARMAEEARRYFPVEVEVVEGSFPGKGWAGGSSSRPFWEAPSAPPPTSSPSFPCPLWRRRGKGSFPPSSALGASPQAAPRRSAGPGSGWRRGAPSAPSAPTSAPRRRCGGCGRGGVRPLPPGGGLHGVRGLRGELPAPGDPAGGGP